MKNDLISIIIPMYNAELYIQRCLDSLINQSYKQKEIIIVDDGSLDNSLNIAKDYMNRYSNIIIIEKENGGVSSARNAGLEVAKGKWIMFVDSDDWCEKEMCSEMIALANNTDYDIICSGYKVDNVNGENLSEIKNDKMIIGNDLNKIGEILHFSNISYCFAKIYKREVIVKNKIKFKENLAMGEDAIFCCDYLLKINNALLINNAYYHYVRANKESLSTKYITNIEDFIENVWDRIEILYNKYPIFKELEHEDNSTREINSSKMYLYNNYRRGCKLSSKQRQLHIKKYMDDPILNEQIKQYHPISNKDKLYYILYKTKCPFVMDSVYSLRLIIISLIGYFKGVKK